MLLDMHKVVGAYDILMITLDTLRYDIAVQELAQGHLPTLVQYLPGQLWQKCHSPGSFTYAAHHAFFAGFFPTPASPGRYNRLFALSFPESQTTNEYTYVFDAPNIVSGLTKEKYHTICIGGVGFFNQLTPLGSVLPGLFQQSFWQIEFGVTEKNSSAFQIEKAISTLDKIETQQRIFLFINISAIHQPNFFYIQDALEDNLQTHAAALRYVDSQLRVLFDYLKPRRPTFCIICSDHGTAYGEQGYIGHRLAHEVVWTVPYSHFFL